VHVPATPGYAQPQKGRAPLRRFLYVALTVLLLHGTAFAKVQGLEGATEGTHWYGPKHTLESMKGHVVIWENWGYN
jgi:hypothetical protein